MYWLVVADHSLDVLQVVHVERVGAAQRHPDAVQCQLVVGTDRRQLPRNQTARSDMIVGKDLEPGDFRLLAQDPVDVRCA